MRPSNIQLRVLGLWVLLALGLALARSWLTSEQVSFYVMLWWGSGLGVLFVAVMDAFALREVRMVSVSREMPGSFSLGASNAIKLTINNPFERALEMTVFDQFPKQLVVDAFPCHIIIPAMEYAEIHYEAKPVIRGDVQFGNVELRIRSRWKLWDYSIKTGEPATVKIYPNFANINTFLKLEHGQQINQLGIHVQQRRGEGMNFHQLREYRKGDAMSQIDWKATARHVKLISREYEDERDQDIIFLLDCGRRMRTHDGELSHFDQALNAVLLTAYMALNQGDAAGLLTFAGDTRWIPPVKGKTSINTLLNRIYDLHSTTNTSDFIQAAEIMMAYQRKRALVIIVSNIREEDRQDLQVATKTLAKHHLVMVASIREQFLDDVESTQVNDFESALQYTGVLQFKEQRQRVLERLAEQGVVITDSLAKHFHIDLANQYLNLKRSGRI
ncbi:MAG: DUF58 domain-containing protein [Gammaproteobacteria bacterium]|nr:DUF58 domain-containing protein [Gammaproteobacteria bacterium]MDH5803138.1 DUF58 domain-containing protein [Gammaproteobacteria bacterium]